MEQYNQYIKQHQQAVIGIILLLCIVLIGGVTYDTILLHQTKQLVISTDNDVEHTDSDVQNTDNDVEQTNQNVGNTDNDVQGNGQTLQQIEQDVNGQP